MIYAGIDYSITSPAITVCDTNKKFKFENLKFYFYTDIKKSLNHGLENVEGTIHKDWKYHQERYDNISDWALDVLQKNNVLECFLEGYSMGSKSSSLFQIGENTGLLKYKLFQAEINCDAIAPTAVKKSATGKGNATKELMQEQFIKETGIDIKKLMNLTDKQWNPSSDVIDSYFILKTGLKLK